MTATTSAQDPREIVRQAQEEADEAEQLVVALEERVRGGDEAVTSEEVEKARGLARFAHMRIEGAAKKAARLAAEAEAARRASIVAEHLPKLEGRDDLIDAELEKAREHVRAALALARSTNSSVMAIAHLADSEGNPYYPEDNPEVIGSHANPFTTWFETKGQRHTVLTPLNLITQLVAPLGLSITVESVKF